MSPLPEPTTASGREGLAALLAEPGRALLCLDFDGTLAPIVPDPAQARAHPDVPPVLRRLAGAGVQVAVVTGRPADLAVEYGAVSDVSRLIVLGHYGAQRWEAGRLTGAQPPAGVAEVRRRLPDLLAAADPGVWVEDKGAAVAVHTRRTPDPAGTFDALRGPLRALADELGLVLEPGRLVLELRPPGGDKGDAVRALAGEAKRSSVTFIGDDLGDLAAFDAVDELRSAGTPGLLVCSGSTEVTAVAERADLVVDGPEGVAGFLARVAERMPG